MKEARLEQLKDHLYQKDEIIFAYIWLCGQKSGYQVKRYRPGNLHW